MRSGLKPAMTKTQREAQANREATVGNLTRQSVAKTERGREVQAELQQVNQDYFGDNSKKPVVTGALPTKSSAGTSSAGGAGATNVMSKSVPLVTDVLGRGWSSGPSNQEGRIFDASDRNLLCMDVQGNQAVVGSADHGLRTFNIQTGKPLRTLYSKAYGHSEWVTSCAYLPDGRILSGGMDSKLCLWDRAAVKCLDLVGHSGSVSQVAVNDHGVAVSASYDRTLKVWDCRGRGSTKPMSSLNKHTSPVTHFAWTHESLISADRSGKSAIWDLESGSLIGWFKGTGQAGSTCISHDADLSMSLLGDMSGTLHILDTRSGNVVAEETLHPGGSLTAITMTTMAAGGNYIVTAGADKQMHVLDLRKGLQPVSTFKEHKDFIYSLHSFGNYVCSGGGNGWLLVHDVLEGKCLYGLGANEAAVRSIFATQEYLVAAGDDGKAIVYDMA